MFILVVVAALTVVVVIVQRRRRESWRTIAMNSVPGAGAILVNLPDSSPGWRIAGWVGVAALGLVTIAIIVSGRRRQAAEPAVAADERHTGPREG